MLHPGDSSQLYKEKYKVKMKACKIVLQAKGRQKKSGVAILISDKIDFIPKIGQVRRNAQILESYKLQ